MTTRRGMGRMGLLAIFTVSGFSGLIYESIWSHYFKLFLGHSAYAQSLVLTVFMGGMALGAFLAARFTPRLRNLLAVYAAVEVLTGLIALAFHPVYVSSVGFIFDDVIPSMGSPLSINLLKWSFAALLILPQSILLGSTFPLISGGAVRRFTDRPGATLALLYFTNSLGAALGVLASGFWLIETLGLPGTVAVAGVVNILLGLTVWMLRGTEPTTTPAVAAPEAAAADTALTRRILVIAFASGAAAFVYEIAWIRMLSLVLGSSTHAFELMLSAFIFGLAFGGWWIRSRIDSIVDSQVTLATMFAIMAGLGALTLPAYGFTFDVVAAAMRLFEPTEAGYVGFNFVSHAIAAAVMIPTTFVAGMTLPVMTHALYRRADERVIGKVYASNTLGAIAGVLIAVHLLLPAAGLKGAVLAGALLQLGIALTLRAAAPRPVTFFQGYRAVLASAGVIVLIGALLTLDPLRMASGVYRKGQARLPADTHIPFMRDGKTATVALAEHAGTMTISTNGKPDAAINMNPAGHPNPDEITMAMAAFVPLAMFPDAKHIANIGIGSGLTSHLALASSNLEQLDTIEIEPAMAEAARLGFGARVARTFEDPRSHLHFEDAKTFFSAAGRRYDVIISEPSNPWVSGVATLFSGEFYAQIKRHLEHDGLLVQWVQIYETDLTIIASIVGALSPHFADYQVFSTDDANILIVASPNGAVPPLQARIFDDPGLAAELRRSGLWSLGDIEIRRIGNRRMLDPLMRSFGVPANSDFRPYVDLNAPRMRFLNRDALDLVRLSHLPVPLSEIFGQPLSAPVSDSADSARYFLRHRLASQAREVLAASESADVANAPVDVREQLGAIDIDAASCGEPTRRRTWLDAVHDLAAHTTAFVPPAERLALWQRLRSAPCAAALESRERAWFELLAAIAAADNRAIAGHGSALFQNPPDGMSGNQVIEALLVTSAAMAAIGDRQEAIALTSAYLPMLENAGRYTLALRVVTAFVNDSR